MIINFANLGGGGGGSDPRLTSSAFTGVEYISSAKTIEFSNLAGNVIGSIDASDFVIDGMVEDVYLSGSSLVIDFNTESGKQDIVIDLTDYINPALYYTSAQTDTLISNAKDEVYASGVSYTNAALAGIDLSAAVASAKTYTDGEISALTTHLEDVEEVTASALTELHTDVVNLSAYTISGLTAKLDVADFELSDRAVSEAINDLNSKKVASDDVRDIVKMTQAEYDALSGNTSSTTLYVIINQ